MVMNCKDIDYLGKFVFASIKRIDVEKIAEYIFDNGDADEIDYFISCLCEETHINFNKIKIESIIKANNSWLAYRYAKQAKDKDIACMAEIVVKSVEVKKQ